VSLEVEPHGSLPAARVEPAGPRPWERLGVWLLPALAFFAVLAVWADVRARRGPRVALHAAEGHGIRPGDPLRYRGIAVGEVESVELAPDLSEVRIELSLARASAGLAREGARFWIVRPTLGLEGVRGLETLLGARYLSVLPGPEGAAPASEFVALPEPPIAELEEPGLEIVLEARERSGLVRGAPLLFRGIPVGSVVSVGLASDAGAVEVRARVQDAYAELVRADTRFWELSGARFSLGLSGLEVEVSSLRSLLTGGIGLATPTHPGARAVSGQRFSLAREPEEEWLEWKPALALGSALLPGGAALPELQRVQLVWEQGRIFGRSRSRAGWALRIGEGWIAPADVFTRPEDAREGSVILELQGQCLPLVGEPTWTRAGIASRALDVQASEPWPGERSGPLTQGVDCLVVGDPALAPLALAAQHLRPAGEAWIVSSDVTLEDTWHGAAVLSRADGKLVGFLLVEEGRARIVPWPSTFERNREDGG
jgi:hypothetical protein